MRAAFLLRFQEFIDANPPPDLRAGTSTFTRVRAEQSDADPGGGGHLTFPRPAEAGAASPGANAGVESGGRSTSRPATPARPVPPQPPVPVGQTKTVTLVRAEADDADPRRASLNAIPTCS